MSIVTRYSNELVVLYSKGSVKQSFDVPIASNSHRERELGIHQHGK